MHPYLPFAALPLAVTAAWFAASHWSAGELGRYRVPSVTQIEEPAVPAKLYSQSVGRPDIRVAAFLPHLPSRAPAAIPELILHSVMTGTDGHLAAINGQVVREGDAIEGYLVKRITFNGVDLVEGGKTRRLPMRPLHELPPPAKAGADTVQRDAAVKHSRVDLAQNFSATFESP